MLCRHHRRKSEIAGKLGTVLQNTLIFLSLITLLVYVYHNIAHRNLVQQEFSVLSIIVRGRIINYGNF